MRGENTKVPMQTNRKRWFPKKNSMRISLMVTAMAMMVLLPCDRGLNEALLDRKLLRNGKLLLFIQNIPINDVFVFNVLNPIVYSNSTEYDKMRQ
mmetsp:Transcript_13837/g.29095  ORF Transcript_13837/g.29095 Transcript_13837/m.29095 type:complete len:95 (+) Transcript_13837:472-756(+)